MKLVFFSGGHLHENQHLYRQALLLAADPDPIVTFIPNSSIDGEVEFEEVVEAYYPLGVRRFLYFPLDVPFDPVLEAAALTGHIIHMGGGNTFYFLKHLRSSKFLQKLKAFVKEGGVLTGLSAGAIVMTPSIDTASFPSFDCDVNEEHLRNFKSMNLAPFHFFPHYKASKRYDQELAQFSKTIATPLYASPDGSGIIVSDSNITFAGRTIAFVQGKKTIINPLKVQSFDRAYQSDSNEIQ